MLTCPPPPPSTPPQLADYFIRWWTRDEYNRYEPDCTGLCGGMFYVRYYGILGIGCFLGFMIFRGAFLYIWSLGASQRMHEKSIHRVLYAPLGFFLQVGAGCSRGRLGGWLAGSPSVVFTFHRLCSACLPPSLATLHLPFPPTPPRPCTACLYRRPPWVTCSSASPRTRTSWTTPCPTRSTMPESTPSSCLPQPSPSQVGAWRIGQPDRLSLLAANAGQAAGPPNVQRVMKHLWCQPAITRAQSSCPALPLPPL
jgi:hypothetical protein